MKRNLYLTSVCICLGIVSACTLPQSAIGISQEVTSAWIDKPLNESVHPLGPIDILFHGADMGGISQYELSVDSAILVDGPSPDPAKTLVTISHTWDPPGPGNYTLQARVMNHDDRWSDPASVTITIGEPTPTVTPTVTPTSTPEGTTFSAPSTSTKLFYYRIADCPDKTPNQVTIEISATDPDEIVNVELYYRLKYESNNAFTPWQSRVMRPSGNGVYRQTIDANDLPPYGAGGEAWFQYQFITSNRAGLISRTEVYYDVTIKGCGP